MRVQDIPGMLTAGVERIKTSSILAPLLAMTFIVGVIALIATPLLHDYPIILGAVWTVFFISAIFAMTRYSYWEKTDPKRLQTEDYQIAERRLLLIGDERDPRVISFTADATLTANNALTSSSTNTGGGQ